MNAVVDALPLALRARIAPLIAEARRRHRRRRRRWIVAATLAVVLAGASYGFTHRGATTGAGSQPTIVPANLPHPCRLATNSEVAAVLGRPVQSRVKLWAGTCKWTGVPYNEGYYNPITFSLSAATMTRAQFEKTIQPGDVRLTGIGEIAYKPTGPAYLVSAFDHGYALILQGRPDWEPAEQQLAKRIFARLR